jgi:hypothetical protein
MKNHPDRHLEDDQLIRALVDTSDLPEAVRRHLSACERCRSRKTDLEEELARLNRMAEESTPAALRPVRLPVRETPARGRLPGKWLTAVGLTASAAAAVLILWTAGILEPRSEFPDDRLPGDRPSAEQLMLEVTRLVENPLPAVYLKITGETSAGVDEDFFRFLIPQENQLSSISPAGKKGKAAC